MDKLKPEQQRFIDELYDQYYDSLLRYATRFLDGSSAEDAVQSIFMDACAKIDVLVKHEDVAGWLFKGLRFSIGKILRSKQQLVKNTVLAPPHAEPETGARIGIEELPDVRPANEDVDILYGDLAVCPEFQLVKKFAVEDKSVKDIARECGISEGACRTRLFRAREKLRLLWKK